MALTSSQLSSALTLRLRCRTILFFTVDGRSLAGTASRRALHRKSIARAAAAAGRGEGAEVLGVELRKL